MGKVVLLVLIGTAFQKCDKMLFLYYSYSKTN